MKPAKKKLAKKNQQLKKKDELQKRKSKSKVQLSSVGSFSDSDENSKKTYKVPVEIFNSGQVYADILNKANREPQFLFMLKNLLSGCARLRQDKKSQYRKKWKMLRNSNCTQNEYLSRQNEVYILLYSLNVCKQNKLDKFKMIQFQNQLQQIFEDFKQESQL